MVNPGEVLIKAVNQRQAKDAVRLEPKGTWSGTGAPNSPVADGAPPAERHDLNPGVDREGERSNPVVSPRGKADCKEG